MLCERMRSGMNVIVVCSFALRPHALEKECYYDLGMRALSAACARK